MFKSAKIIFLIFLVSLLGLALRSEEGISQRKTPVDTAQSIKDFVRFIPDNQGDTDWEVEGSAANFISPELIQINNVVAISHDQKIGDLTIKVGQVLFDTRTNEARAEGEWVDIRRENIVVTGRGIFWNPAQKQIRVLEDARVLIKEKNNLGLFPL